jgi:hypothetical protein
MRGTRLELGHEGRGRTAIIFACIPAGSLLTAPDNPEDAEPLLLGGRPARPRAAWTWARGEVAPLLRFELTGGAGRIGPISETERMLFCPGRRLTSRLSELMERWAMSGGTSDEEVSSWPVLS